MNNGDMHLRPKGNRKLKIMTKRASGILNGEENLEATKASQAEKKFLSLSQWNLVGEEMDQLRYVN